MFLTASSGKSSPDSTGSALGAGLSLETIGAGLAGGGSTSLLGITLSEFSVVAAFNSFSTLIASSSAC